VKKLSTIILFCTTAAFLAGCSGSRYNIQDRDKSYTNARSIQPTKVPAGLASNGIENYYPVPDRSYPPSAQQVSIVPPGLPGAASN
jgi:uncharacterized lipoprotein